MKMSADFDVRKGGECFPFTSRKDNLLSDVQVFFCTHGRFQRSETGCKICNNTETKRKRQAKLSPSIEAVSKPSILSVTLILLLLSPAPLEKTFIQFSDLEIKQD